MPFDLRKTRSSGFFGYFFKIYCVLFMTDKNSINYGNKSTIKWMICQKFKM